MRRKRKNKTGEEEEEGEDQEGAGGQAVAQADKLKAWIRVIAQLDVYQLCLQKLLQLRKQLELSCHVLLRLKIEYCYKVRILTRTRYNTACMCALPYTGTNKKQNEASYPHSILFSSMSPNYRRST